MFGVTALLAATLNHSADANITILAVAPNHG
jgi:hypothetical protein